MSTTTAAPPGAGGALRKVTVPVTGMTCVSYCQC